MKYCCENIEKAIGLLKEAENWVNTTEKNIEDNEMSDFGKIAGIFFTAGIANQSYADQACQEYRGWMNKAFEIIKETRTKIDSCNCGKTRDYWKREELKERKRANSLDNQLEIIKSTLIAKEKEIKNLNVTIGSLIKSQNESRNKQITLNNEIISLEASLKKKDKEFTAINKELESLKSWRDQIEERLKEEGRKHQETESRLFLTRKIIEASKISESIEKLLIKTENERKEAEEKLHLAEKKIEVFEAVRERDAMIQIPAFNKNR